MNLPAHIEIFWFLLNTLPDSNSLQDLFLPELELKSLVVQSGDSLLLPVSVRIDLET